ncbi:hypothetical protein ZYGR_0AF03400 [Zygosaccharomyces rouxii]|uniref:Cytochrome c oxidase assembly protein COX20, mitochondrial n=1 Tax=Zygosaccharomyces rouxii TaxID=4956 RepID=A0A1Q3A810_ZYGRO|nr:hypothetical protein ZYGR_0AF03400 [Zygosaccharomyces rouxii]
MGWWPWKSKKDESTSEPVPEVPSPSTSESVPTSYSRGQKILLEDTSPKFSNEMSQSQIANSKEQISFKQAWETVSWRDFSVAKLTSIPCFRDSGLIGFTSMFVMGGVTFLYHKNPARAVNWSIGGLLLGSVVGWEQCRMRRKRSFQIAQMAKQTMANKERPMRKSLDHDERIKGQWDDHHATASEHDGKKKPWFKFW